MLASCTVVSVACVRDAMLAFFADCVIGREKIVLYIYNAHLCRPCTECCKSSEHACNAPDLGLNKQAVKLYTPHTADSNWQEGPWSKSA